MYGLTSRESLSKRQSRWVREADESVRSNPAQNAFARDVPSNPLRDKRSIITAMTSSSNQKSSVYDDIEHHNNDPRKSFNSHLMDQDRKQSDYVSLDDIETIQSLYEEVKQKCSKLELECESLRKSIGPDLISRVQKLEQSIQRTQSSVSSTDLEHRIEKIEESIKSNYQISSSDHRSISAGLNSDNLVSFPEINAIISRVTSLEQSLSELSSLSILDPSIHKSVRRLTDNSSEFSALTEPDINRTDDGIREFLPYFIKEDYAGRDNHSKLDGNHLEMIVEILGFYSENPVIYPFGNETHLPKFVQCELDMTFTDADSQVNGIAYGIFKCDSSGIYSIKITELNSDGDASGLEKYTLPLIFKCNTNLFRD
jgi:hypothetical protein